MKFKVGQRVKVIPGYGTDWRLNDEVVTITEILSNQVKIQGHLGHAWVDPEILMLVKLDTKMRKVKKMKFRKGQMVKLHPDYKFDAHGLKVGQEYPVYSFDAKRDAVMFMGVTEHWVNAISLIPVRKKRKSKRR